jgi:hypothetical protein
LKPISSILPNNPQCSTVSSGQCACETSSYGQSTVPTVLINKACPNVVNRSKQKQNKRDTRINNDNVKPDASNQKDQNAYDQKRPVSIMNKKQHVLYILSANVNGLRGKYNEICLRIESAKPHIFALQETKLGS